MKMNDRDLLVRFIKEVINEYQGIYSWSWFPIWDDNERENIIQNDPELWREKILRNDWMINSPDWNVFEVGIHLVNVYGKVIFHEDLTFLVEKTLTLEEFDKEIGKKLGCPTYIEWIYVYGNDGYFYENTEEPEEPFKSTIYKDDKTSPEYKNVSLKDFDPSLKYAMIL